MTIIFLNYRDALECSQASSLQNCETTSHFTYMYTLKFRHFYIIIQCITFEKDIGKVFPYGILYEVN